ncbi:hypothetical protein CORC01_07526 [Colletotrichum orchidophilum]|uniref:Uncharacterized protein n=1 Tax=Colletotrichum orchidophilum TaxID=1209926 RepID=A0A1G4B7L7_9PEZI|nr:uncharacterized protein CORC01_07526 [Colletotrichum orchidophilum]OHE97272.1 hypothetical protein CORC01_07526 [Colletotrichum orchidophilum]
MITWDEDINFASALLLHSCLTVLIKETLNVLTVTIRLAPFRRNFGHGTSNSRSVLLDGYTSILSNDNDGDLAELYFTNTGLLLLSASLASAIAMNLFLSDTVLNVFVACTFGFCFVVSIFSCRRSWLRFILALRRAGRFVWSDTPFVNFFSLIYVAVVLKNSTTMRLKDYVTLRSIAIIELVFMKAYIAAASMDRQVELLRSLHKSRLVLFQGKKLEVETTEPLRLERSSIVPFTTAQRMSVMLIKTTVGHDFGSVRGSKGPGSIPVPPAGFFANDDAGSGDWRIYRVRDDIMLIADSLCSTDPKERWKRLIKNMHGIFLKQLKKVRVVYLLKVGGSTGYEMLEIEQAIEADKIVFTETATVPVERFFQVSTWPQSNSLLTVPEAAGLRGREFINPEGDVVSHESLNFIRLQHLYFIKTDKGYMATSHARPEIGEKLVALLVYTEALLGALPDGWRVRMARDSGFFDSMHFFSVTADEATKEDPRLGEDLPDWERREDARTGDDPWNFTRSRSRKTKEIIDSDSRLKLQALSSRKFVLKGIA